MSDSPSVSSLPPTPHDLAEFIQVLSEATGLDFTSEQSPSETVVFDLVRVANDKFDTAVFSLTYSPGTTLRAYAKDLNDQYVKA